MSNLLRDIAGYLRTRAGCSNLVLSAGLLLSLPWGWQILSAKIFHINVYFILGSGAGLTPAWQVFLSVSSAGSLFMFWKRYVRWGFREYTKAGFNDD